ncbi:MAG TPA: hypothetical protein ENG66_04515 [Thermococcus sp.]|nr:hypothetical protein [Thermococcus sp.]
MIITIRPVKCGNRNCIGLVSFHYKMRRIPRLIVIEDVWDIPVELLEEAIVGLISHETIEWILATWELQGKVPRFLDLHNLLGQLTIKDYCGNTDGLPKIKLLKKKSFYSSGKQY